MRWKSARRSQNVEFSRRGGLRLGGGLGLGGLALLLAFGLITGQRPDQLLQMLSPEGVGSAPPQHSETTEFVRAILGETEDVWGALFDSGNGRYVPPRLVLFSGMVRSGCGGASAATGPFYCPLDQRVYLDTAFFEQMRAELGGGGDFAYAYVIGHEVAHHVQHLLGTLQAADRGAGAGADSAAVRVELQADCLAGVWAHHAQARRQWLEPGDLEEALRTASAIGDDRLQQRTQGTVVPDSFTHGTSAQRVRWFREGYAHGAPARCDTFAARQL